MNRTFKDLSGKKFGRLTAIEKVGDAIKRNGVLWRCKCDCGNEKIVPSGYLKSGNTASCGCLFIESRYRKRDGVKNKIYGERICGIHEAMIQRCYNKNCAQYDNYGGRGISVCEEWRNNGGCRRFYNWSISNGYRNDLSIDRIDVNGNYEPSNCRWATAKEQANNRRNNRFLEYMGEKHTVDEWSKIIGIHRATIYKRLKKNLPINQVLQKDSLQKRRKK